MKNLVLGLTAVSTLASAGTAFARDDKPEARPWVIWADRVYTGTGTNYEAGMVGTAGSKISIVAPRAAGMNTT